MPQEIKIEIDPESYAEVYGKLLSLYKMAEKIDSILQSAQQSVQRIGYWFAFLSFCAGVGAGWVMSLAYIANR